MKKLMIGLIVIANLCLLASCDNSHKPKTTDDPAAQQASAPASSNGTN